MPTGLLVFIVSLVFLIGLGRNAYRYLVFGNKKDRILVAVVAVIYAYPFLLLIDKSAGNFFAAIVLMVSNVIWTILIFISSEFYRNITVWNIKDKLIENLKENNGNRPLNISDEDLLKISWEIFFKERKAKFMEEHPHISEEIYDKWFKS